MKPNGEPKVQHGEDGLSAESLNALKKEEVEHSKHKTIDQGQKAIQQTPGPQHQQTPSTTVETSGWLPLDTKAVPECKKDLEDGSHMSHLAGRLNKVPFTGTDYQEVGLREKLDVDVIRECKGDQGGEEDEEKTTNKPEGPAFWTRITCREWAIARVVRNV